MFFATALQCVRQYLLTDFKLRLDNQTAAKRIKDHLPEHSNRLHQWYNPSLAEVMTNPAPFDAMNGSPTFDLHLSGLTHRQKTLGHDPVLGWIFGTANIATSTITTNNFLSYHVKTNNALGRDRISNNARTDLVLYYTKQKLFDDGIEGRKIIGASLIKELIHLKSDINTKKSLPLPIIGVFSPAIAESLSSYGLDMANVLTVAKQAACASMINAFIGMIHYLYYDSEQDKSRRLYEVRTHKIITYSNLIASTSNILYAAINAMAGNAAAIGKLDIGGFLVTLYRLTSDYSFILKIKEEFIFGNFNRQIRGETQ
jgi:hypothetical protein